MARPPAGLVRYLVLGAGLVAVVVLVVGLVDVLALAVGRTPGMWAWLGGAAAIAVLVPVARPTLDRLADRAAYGREGDPYAVLADFVHRISETLAVDDVMPQLARTAVEATRSSSGAVRVWLADGGERRESWPPEAGPIGAGEVGVVLEHAGERVGRLEVAGAEETLRESDRLLLARLAAPAGVALSNVRLTHELRRRLAQTMALSEQIRLSRQRLLDSGRDQQERFVSAVQRRVLPRLDALDAHVLALAGGTSALPAAESEARACLEALRELAAGLFPPALSERGLAAALDGHFDQHGEPVVVTDAGGGSVRYPLAAESAAYFCCIAVTDEITSAGRATIELGMDPTELTFRIRGAIAPVSAVLELVRDRVEALDGRVDVVDDASGCDVTARLPALPPAAAEADVDQVTESAPVPVRTEGL